MFNIPGFPSAVLIKSDGFGIVILKGEAALGCIADVEYGVQRLGGKHVASVLKGWQREREGCFYKTS